MDTTSSTFLALSSRQFVWDMNARAWQRVSGKIEDCLDLLAQFDEARELTE